MLFKMVAGKEPPQHHDAGSMGHMASPESVVVIKKMGNE